MSGTKNQREEEKLESDHVNLKVKGQDGSEVFFKIQKKAQLKKLMKKYCERQGLVQREIAFLLDGHAINGNKTPEQLELKDEAEIDAMKHHGGGGRANCIFL